MLERASTARLTASTVDATARRVGDLLTRPLLTCSPETAVRDAAERMVSASADCVVVVDALGEPVGTLSDGDLRRAVATGLTGSVRVDVVMATPPITIDAEAYFFEAVQAILRHRRRQLVVVEGGKPRGVIADTDLLAARAQGPLFVSRRIEQARSVDQLAVLGPLRVAAVRLLQRAGVPAKQLALITADVNDQLVARILTLVEAELGPPPLAYCWLGLGSEGRREQTLHTDQDNALIYEDPPEDLADAAAGYFSRLAERAVTALERCGFPRCRGGVNADNPRWCRPLGAWREHFAEWIHRPRPEALLNAAIFFDLRPVGGSAALAEVLWSDLARWIPRSAAFTKLLLAEALTHRPPIRPLRGLVVDHSGEHRGGFDLKWGAIMPIVEPARILALARGITTTNTVDRLHALREQGQLGARDADDLVAAFDFLMGIRIKHHLDRLEVGEQPDDHLVPEQLPRVEALMLKEHLKVVAQLQGFFENQLQVGSGA